MPKRDGDIPTETSLTGASTAGGVGKKRDSGRVFGFAAYTSHSVINRTSREVWNKAATDGVEPSTHGGVRRSLFSQDDDEVFVTGSTLYTGDGGRTPRTQPPWS